LAEPSFDQRSGFRLIVVVAHSEDSHRQSGPPPSPRSIIFRMNHRANHIGGEVKPSGRLSQSLTDI
jgi:hypothetical protein